MVVNLLVQRQKYLEILKENETTTSRIFSRETWDSLDCLGSERNPLAASHKGGVWNRQIRSQNKILSSL